MQLISYTLFWTLSKTAMQPGLERRAASVHDETDYAGGKGLRAEEGVAAAARWVTGGGLDSYKSAGAFDRPVIYVTMALTMGSGPAVFH